MNYFDYDLGSSFSDDSATYRTIAGPTTGRIEVTDSNSDIGVAREGVFDSWQIGAYGQLDSQISNGTGLSESGSPFGPGDFTGALQWDIQIPVWGGQQVFASTGSIGSEVPEVGQVLSAGLLLFVGLVRRRR